MNRAHVLFIALLSAWCLGAAALGQAADKPKGGFDEKGLKAIGESGLDNPEKLQRLLALLRAELQQPSKAVETPKGTIDSGYIQEQIIKTIGESIAGADIGAGAQSEQDPRVLNCLRVSAVWRQALRRRPTVDAILAIGPVLYEPHQPQGARKVAAEIMMSYPCIECVPALDAGLRDTWSRQTGPSGSRGAQRVYPIRDTCKRGLRNLGIRTCPGPDGTLRMDPDSLDAYVTPFLKAYDNRTLKGIALMRACGDHNSANLMGFYITFRWPKAPRGPEFIAAAQEAIQFIRARMGN